MTATPFSERLRQASYPVGAAVVVLALWEAGVRLFRCRASSCRRPPAS